MIKILCYICYFIIPIICNSNVNLILEGLNSELEYNVRKKLSKIDCSITHISVDFQKQLNHAIRSSLSPLGYYNPTIDFLISLEKPDNKQSNTLTIKINIGEPIKVNAININISGDAQYDNDYQQIIKESQFFIGKKLNHNDYEQLKNKLYNLAIYKGYFDSKFYNSQLIVIPDLYQCIWNINFNSGKRYIFEDIKFQGSQIKTNYLKNICNIRLGEYYHAKSIIELNRRLSSTNWFESIFTSSNFIICSQKKN